MPSTAVASTLLALLVSRNDTAPVGAVQRRADIDGHAERFLGRKAWLGAVVVLGGFVLAVRQRRQAGDATSTATVISPAPVEAPGIESTAPAPAVARAADGGPVTPPVPPAEEWPHVERRRVERRTSARVGPIPPGEDEADRVGPILLPPGWYGNPDIPGGPVQWWDDTRLVDRPR